MKGNRQLCAYIPREKKRQTKDSQQHGALRQRSKPCVSTSSSVTATTRPKPQAEVERSQASSNIAAPSSWVKEHDHWLSQYVHFLVYGNESAASDAKDFNVSAMSSLGANNPAAANVEGSFVPNLGELEHVTLEDVCDEIVMTFGHANRDNDMGNAEEV